MQEAGSHQKLKMRYLEEGEGGSVLLLLHGLHESLEGFRSVIERFKQHLHVYALDFRGHGQTSWLEPYRVRDYAADVTTFVRSKIGAPIFLSGHSLGGLVGAYIASHQPEMILGLILEDPPIFTSQMPTIMETPFYPVFIEVRKLLEEHQNSGRSAEDMEKMVGEWRVGTGSQDASTWLEVFGEEYVSRFALDLHRTDPRTLDPILEGTFFDGFNPDEDLPKIACPTHLIAGNDELGSAVRAEDVERVTSLIPACSHVVWEDVGHDIHVARPGRYAQEVLAFVEANNQLG